MREVGKAKYTVVYAVDEPAFDANHKYTVGQMENRGDPNQPALQSIGFQKGPIKEHGVNGCMNEDLLLMIIDRLQSFQKSKFACRENALALTKLEEALHWLNHRTAGREERSVEGTHEV